MRQRMHYSAGVLCAAGLALASVLSAAAASAGTSARQGTSAAPDAAHLRSAASSAQATRPSAAGAGRAAASRAASALPVNYSFATGFAENFASPSAAPPGANNFSCHPSSAHPYPVILVHGTFGNMNDNWQAASAVLANHGYCVFAFNYGGAPANADFQGTGEIAASAGQLASFVTKVLAATGAVKVDTVGHSQGGMMPRYHLKFLGGAAKVSTLVGLAPSNRVRCAVRAGAGTLPVTARQDLQVLPPLRGRSSMVEPQPSKLVMPVRSRSPALMVPVQVRGMINRLLVAL